MAHTDDTPWIGAAAALPRPGPAQEKLAAFTGRWSTQGQALASPFGPAAPITVAQTYEWLSGGMFLIHRFYGRLGGSEMACVEVYGAQGDGGAYDVYSFYNDGARNVWQMRANGSTWTLSGSWPSAQGEIDVRCTIVFDPSGNAATSRWQHSQDGRWHTFWDTRMVRS